MVLEAGFLLQENGIEDVGTGKYQEFEADWRYNDGEIEIDVSSWKLTGRVLQVGFTVM